MARIVLHAGYPKCASTLLQKYLFPAQSGLWLVHDEVTVDALTLAEHPGGETRRREVLQELADRLAAFPGTAVISCEHLCMPARWLDTGAGVGRRRLSRPDIIELLGSYLPPQRVLLVVRDQLRWLSSWYQQRIKAYETLTMARLLETPLFRDDVLPSLCYEQVVADYEAAFGQDTVSVLPFELLAQQPGAFVEQVHDALALPPEQRHAIDITPVNSSLSRLGLLVQRWLNRLIVKAADWRTDGFDPQHGLIRSGKALLSLDWIAVRLFGKYSRRPHLSRDVLSRFAASNRRLEARFDLGLPDYGYLMDVPCGSDPVRVPSLEVTV